MGVLLGPYRGVMGLQGSVEATQGPKGACWGSFVEEEEEEEGQEDGGGRRRRRRRRRRRKGRAAEPRTEAGLVTAEPSPQGTYGARKNRVTYATTG